MKVLLIQPDYSSVYRDIGEPVHEPPLGLLYLASVLEERGHEVAVLDMVFENQRRAFTRLVGDADFLGVTVTTPLFNEALEVCRRGKEVNPEVTTILGGPHISATGMKSYRRGLTDFLVMGEGERAIVEIVEGKRVKPLVQGEAVEDLDSLPFPDRGLLELERYQLVIPGGGRGLYTTILTARGCPHRCVFCDSHLTFGRRVRFRSPRNVFEEFKECVEKYGIRHFGLLDDTTTINKKRWMKVCQLLIDSGLNIKYHCATRVDAVDEELLKAMKQSGCYRLHIGCESGDPGVLKRIRKGITLEQIERCFKLCKKVGISTYAYFMIGLPGETEETVRRTVEFAIRLDPDYFQYSIAMPFPGTELYEWCMENNLFIENVDYGDFRWYGNPVFQENIPPERLVELQKLGYKRFYQRPRFIFKQVRSFRDIRRLVKGFLKFRRWVG